MLKMIGKELVFAAAKAASPEAVLPAIERRGRAPSDPTPLSRVVDRVSNYVHERLMLERLARSGVPVLHSARDWKHQIFDYIFDHYVSGDIDYFEFGVYRGDSIAWWLARLGSGSRLFGFDSFEGLPDYYDAQRPKGTFDCGGKPPKFSATNVRFVKGWFDHTLSRVLAETPPRQPLIVHLDADLYSSTIYVLRTMRDVLVPRTIVIFDEFFDVKHEYRAFQEFVAETKKQFEYLVATDDEVAIRFVS